MASITSDFLSAAPWGGNAPAVVAAVDNWDLSPGEATMAVASAVQIIYRSREFTAIWAASETMTKESPLFEQLMEEARQIHPGIQFSGNREGELENIPPALLRYLVSLLRDEPTAAPDAPQYVWDQLWSILNAHWIFPFLYFRINTFPQECAPPKIFLARMRQNYLRSCARAIQQEHQIVEMNGALRDAGIRALVLKGPALAYMVYPNPAMRPGSDLDILVMPEMVTAARSVLEKSGYECRGKRYETARQFYCAEIFSPTRNANSRRGIDMHWDLCAFSTFRQGTELNALFDRAITIETPTGKFEALSPVDALLHRALNNTFHHDADIRCIWLCDVALLAKHLSVPDEWKLLQERSVEWKCRLGLEMLLVLAQRWTGFQFPESVRDFSTWPAPSTIEQAMWDTVTKKRRHLSAYLRLRMRGSSGVIDFLRACLRLLFPESAWMQMEYPPATGWHLPLAYGRRWRRWIEKSLRGRV